MVARVAHFWRMDPFRVWGLPFTAYVALRDDYIDIALPAEKRAELGSDFSLTKLDELADQGINDIDYDAVLRQRRKKKADHG
jgi:hypothetical protein